MRGSPNAASTNGSSPSRTAFQCTYSICLVIDSILVAVGAGRPEQLDEALLQVQVHDVSDRRADGLEVFAHRISPSAHHPGLARRDAVGALPRQEREGRLGGNRGR